ncbi:hypothetical protein BC832DRAFT_318615 [Gaertneriomyces semiglobifer]|nr:hypothetical protein BC832DRAFT_318615 [Gaertneriomyces semiglobifer]
MCRKLLWALVVGLLVNATCSSAASLSTCASQCMKSVAGSVESSASLRGNLYEDLWPAIETCLTTAGCDEVSSSLNDDPHDAILDFCSSWFANEPRVYMRAIHFDRISFTLVKDRRIIIGTIVQGVMNGIFIPLYLLAAD